MVQGKEFFIGLITTPKNVLFLLMQFQLWSICTHINLKLTLFYSS